MPTPDTRKGTIGSLGQIAGMPTTQSAPSTGPTNAPEPADHHDGDHPHRLLRRERDRRACCSGSNVTSRQPASAAMPPDTANASSFMRVVETVMPAADAGLSRTAITERAMPVRRSWATIATHASRNARHR